MPLTRGQHSQLLFKTFQMRLRHQIFLNVWNISKLTYVSDVTDVSLQDCHQLNIAEPSKSQNQFYFESPTRRCILQTCPYLNAFTLKVLSEVMIERDSLKIEAADRDDECDKFRGRVAFTKRSLDFAFLKQKRHLFCMTGKCNSLMSSGHFVIFILTTTFTQRIRGCVIKHTPLLVFFSSSEQHLDFFL